METSRVPIREPGPNSDKARMKEPQENYIPKEQQEEHVKKPQLTTKAEIKEGNVLSGFGHYVIEEQLKPGLLDLGYSMVEGTIDMLAKLAHGINGRAFYPNGGATKANKISNTYTPYNQFYVSEKTNIGTYYDPKDQNVSAVVGGMITVPDKGTANNLRNALIELIVNSGAARVGDLKEMIGVDTTMQDFSFGWKEVSDIQYKRQIGGGYVFDMPQPVRITKN